MNKTLTDVKKRSVAFQRYLKFPKIPNSPIVMTARSRAPSPQITLKNSFLLNYLMLTCLITLKVKEINQFCKKYLNPHKNIYLIKKLKIKTSRHARLQWTAPGLITKLTL